MPLTTRTPIQQRFSDIDAFNHVNNVAQQMYFDVGKSHFFDELLGHGSLFAPTRFITAATNTSYLTQLRLGDAIYVTTQVEHIGTKSVTLLQQIEGNDGTVYSRSHSVMVAFDFPTQQSVPLPPSWREWLSSSE
jgi:acyl-CoA thioesterase FadM